MNIDELTYGQIKEIASVLSNGNQQPSASHPFEIGKPYLIRTVTHISTGVLKSVGKQELVLTDACWIADTGRFADQFSKSTAEMFNEVEPWPLGNDVVIGRGAIIDATKINGLPSSQK